MEIEQALVDIGILVRSAYHLRMPSVARMDRIELRNQLEDREFVPYDYQNFAMDSTQTDKEIGIEGDWLAIDTDGSLDGVTVRFNHKENPAVPIRYFNPWMQPFWRLYLTWTAQSGKTLHVCTGKHRSARMMLRSGTPTDITVTRRRLS